MRELRSNAKCSCDSGLRYGSCCKGKAFKWVVDKGGDRYKQVPLVAEAMEVLRRAEEEFRRIFDRAPSKDSDPVFLWKYLVSEEELERQAIEAMQQAKVRPHIIHAYRRTGGLLISRENEKLATTKDLADWNAAIDEYFELERNPPSPHPIDALLRSFEGELDHCIICLGYVLENGLNRSAKRISSSSVHFSVDDYALICAAKSMKTLRAIKVLLSENIGADGLSLARHLLENYFHIAYAISRPEMLKHLTDAQIGLKLGTHDFARNANGRVDSRRILRKKDGEEYVGHISYYKMAESSSHPEDLELFDYLYNFLSEYTHPSVTGFRLVLGERGELSTLSNELHSEALFYSVCFAALILDELRKLPILSRQAKADIATVTRRVATQAAVLVSALFEDDEISHSFSPLIARMMSVGT